MKCENCKTNEATAKLGPKNNTLIPQFRHLPTIYVCDACADAIIRDIVSGALADPKVRKTFGIQDSKDGTP